MIKKEIRLYNFFFLPWMFWSPTFLFYFLTEWSGRILVLAFLAANFAFDTIVLCLAMMRRNIQDKRRIWKKSIWKIWGIGYLSDIAGTLFSNVLSYLLFYVFRTSPVNVIGNLPLVLPGIVLAGALIYFLNKRFAFTKCGLDPAEVRKLSLALAVFTAPYLLLMGGV